MSKNRKSARAVPQHPTTAQGVRDLNQVGPRRPRSPESETMREVMANARSVSCRTGFRDAGTPERTLPPMKTL